MKTDAEVLAVERSPIVHETTSGKGTLRFGQVGAKIAPFQPLFKGKSLTWDCSKRDALVQRTECLRRCHLECPSSEKMAVARARSGVEHGCGLRLRGRPIVGVHAIANQPP